MKHITRVLLLLSIAWFAYNFYIYFKVDEVALSAEDSYLDSKGNYLSNYKFKNLNVLSVTPKKYEDGQWIVSDDSNKEVVTILAQYSDIISALKEIEEAGLFIEELSIDREKNSLALTIRVRGLSRWMLPF